MAKASLTAVRGRRWTLALVSRAWGRTLGMRAWTYSRWWHRSCPGTPGPAPTGHRHQTWPVTYIGVIQHYVTLFIWKFDTLPPLRTANNVVPYMFIALFSGKSETLPPPTVLSEWPNIPVCTLGLAICCKTQNCIRHNVQFILSLVKTIF